MFILDPESEYGKLAKSMGGKVLDVSSGKFGKINPFQIIRTEDDENKDGTSNDYFSHLQFLEEFYRVVLPGINSDSLELLNRLTQELFSRAGITPYSDLNGISEEEYPIFDDLGKLIDDKIERETDEYNRGCLKVLTNTLLNSVPAADTAICGTGRRVLPRGKILLYLISKNSWQTKTGLLQTGRCCSL